MSRPLLFEALAIASLLGCGTETVVAEDLTGLELTVRYDPDLGLDQLLISAARADGEPLVAVRPRPEEPMPLTSGASSVVIILPEVLSDEDISVRVDGLAAGKLVASGDAHLVLIGRVLVQVDVQLGHPRKCEDGVANTPLRPCDDDEDEERAERPCRR